MSTDITLCVEKKSEGKWISAFPWVMSGWLERTGSEEEKKDEAYFCQNYGFHIDRNYAFFAVLADVRNKWGFPPISQPRGLPNDASKKVRVHIETCSDHSYSWLLLSELLAFDWYARPIPPPNTVPNEWEDLGGTFCHACQDFVERVLPFLNAVGAPEDVRIVFGFDS
jgi:hypothetical protein